MATEQQIIDKFKSAGFNDAWANTILEAIKVAHFDDECNYLTMEVETLLAENDSDLIAYAFNWAHTPQGSGFWVEVSVLCMEGKTKELVSLLPSPKDLTSADIRLVRNTFGDYYDVQVW